mmetsp:Transcript_82442/g.233830  ORF Transcript_82442/g.233830 Transcript_82442/m.233830 type:complete len:202 (-) Transcript_82442:150-755(-)
MLFSSVLSASASPSCLSCEQNAAIICASLHSERSTQELMGSGVCCSQRWPARSARKPFSKSMLPRISGSPGGGSRSYSAYAKTRRCLWPALSACCAGAPPAEAASSMRPLARPQNSAGGSGTPSASHSSRLPTWPKLSTPASHTAPRARSPSHPPGPRGMEPANLDTAASSRRLSASCHGSSTSTRNVRACTPRCESFRRA